MATEQKHSTNHTFWVTATWGWVHNFCTKFCLKTFVIWKPWYLKLCHVCHHHLISVRGTGANDLSSGHDLDCQTFECWDKPPKGGNALWTCGLLAVSAVGYLVYSVQIDFENLLRFWLYRQLVIQVRMRTGSIRKLWEWIFCLVAHLWELACLCGCAPCVSPLCCVRAKRLSWAGVCSHPPTWPIGVFCVCSVLFLVLGHS